MPDYNALAVFVASVGGTFATIIYATQKSRCSTIKTPCISCDRKTDLENQLSNTDDTNDRTDRRESEQLQPLAQSPPVPPSAIAGDRLPI